MKQELKDLYHKMVLDRSRSTSGYQKNEQAPHQIEAYNPVCGDHFKIYVDIEDGTIQEISFHGYGCAISKAATSLLVESMKNQTLETCVKQLQYFFDCMDDQSDAPEIYQALSMSKNFPGRRQCAELSWKAFENFVEDL